MANLMQVPTLLRGDNTIPGVKIHPEILKEIPGILKACRDWGLDFYDTVVEFMDYDGISEVAAYGGFPVRFPHWSWGEQYEDLSRGYEYGMHRIYEMVVNTNPCYIYCLDSNTWVDHVTVIAHATGHNDFFKNNAFFGKTSQNMMNELANHGTRIRKYKQEWGGETVGRFMDKVMSIETLLDSAKAWQRRKSVDPLPDVRRKYEHPRRLKVEAGHEHMEGWINSREYIESEYDRIKQEELHKSIGLFAKPEKDIFGYLKDHAPLKPWQQDILAMMYEESMYFAPQGQTKMLNEGWASRVDSQIMAQYGLAKDDGIFEYAAHKAGVLGGKTSMNPYKLGYLLLTDIEDRWNKGQFGKEWDECEDNQVRAKWDKKLGLGHDKIFQVRQCYNDVTALSEFFTQEFCDKHQFYHWQRFSDGTYKIMDRDAESIKAMLIKRYVNRGLPIIKLVEPNYKGKRIFLMEHEWDGRTLHPTETSDTMRALSAIWRGPCAILTRNKDNKQIMYQCEDDKVQVVDAKGA